MYTGQFVMSGFLDLRISQWKRISITRSVALVPTLLVSLLYRQPGGTELDILNEWLNVLQSVQIPFALLPVLLPSFMIHVKAMGISAAGFAWAVAVHAVCCRGATRVSQRILSLCSLLMGYICRRCIGVLAPCM